MGARAGISAWLELARVSNVPTVWSNALVGVALGAGLASPGAGSALRWGTWLTAAAAMSMLYVAGMIHNDVADAEADAAERPHRPIPSGRVPLLGAMLAAAGLMLGGVVVMFATTLPAVLLAAGLCVLIAVYNTVHRDFAASVVLLAACRAMVVITAAAAVAWPIDWSRVGPMAGLLAAYVIGLSLLARGEAGRPGRIRLVVLLICGISVLDAAVLLVLGQPVAAAVAIGCFALAAILQRRVAGS